MKRTANTFAPGASKTKARARAPVVGPSRRRTRRIVATADALPAAAAQKNPAFKGSALYTVFEVRLSAAPRHGVLAAAFAKCSRSCRVLTRGAQVQAYLSILVGGLLAYNVIWPTDEPSIPRLIVRPPRFGSPALLL